MKKSIALLGPLGTFSQQACEKYNSELTLLFFNSLEEVVMAVAKGKTNFGIVPFENSIHGTVIQTIDEVYKHKLKVIKEVIIPVRHVLAGLKKDYEKKKITKIYSHSQALNQCKSYLLREYPQAKFIPTASTSAAFKKIKDEVLTDSLVVGPKISAEIYNLKILEENIQGVENNKTSFWVIAKEILEGEPFTKTTIVISSEKDYPGLLFEVLKIFKENNINLSKIESRPSKEKLGSYIFYITLDIGEFSLLHRIITGLKDMNLDVCSLGSYCVC